MLVFLLLATRTRPSLLAQAKVNASRQRAAVSVPFVGCVSYGQTQLLEAPKDTNRSVPISPEDAQKVAYYASADGIGLLAPRGWYCEGVSGSGGAALFVSPNPIDRRLSQREGFEGPAIELNHITSENGSGGYEIAEIMARGFPAYRPFANGNWEGFYLPRPAGPYPKDTLTYRSKTVVEYNTPARTEGLGTHFSWLKKNDSPVAGAAILIGDPPELLLLSIRLPHDLARLTPKIIRDVEREAVGSPPRN